MKQNKLFNIIIGTIITLYSSLLLFFIYGTFDQVKDLNDSMTEVRIDRLKDKICSTKTHDSICGIIDDKWDIASDIYKDTIVTKFNNHDVRIKAVENEIGLY